jgi:hypothetical protein
MTTSARLIPKNPFHYLISHDPEAFCGRQKELEIVCGYLGGDAPGCCAIIGENYIGKTSFLRYLTHPEGAAKRHDLGIGNLIFVYIDASPFIDSTRDEQASVQFWWDLYHAFKVRLDHNHAAKQPLSKTGIGRKPIDKAYEIKCAIEELVHEQSYPVIFALDNFQGIASLPLLNSNWLRAMATDYNCAYVVTSRHLLHLFYHTESWDKPSPLWNLFSDRVYLGLLEEREAEELISQKGRLEKFWREEDVKFIKQIAGRHPEFLRMTCANLYGQLQQANDHRDPEEHDLSYDLLEASVYRDASPICNQLWYGLTDPELLGISKSAEFQRDPSQLSMHQQVLIDVAEKGDSTEDSQYLIELQERGLIVRADSKWKVFSGIMQQYVLRQRQVRQMAGLPTVRPKTKPASEDAMPQPAFTYLEGKVYQYLQSHAEEVCDKEEVKKAIWKDKLPSDSTLQKIIERIRRKIEPDPDNPRYLIAVRGQGYILRERLSN